MNESRNSHDDLGLPPGEQSDRQVVYVPVRVGRSDAPGGVDLVEATTVLWRSKWLILGITAVCAVASVIYALSLTHWYRAEVLLAPAEESAIRGVGGAFSDLASLAGASVASSGNAEAVAVLRSRDFTRRFIEDESLLTVLFADQWDSVADQWLVQEPDEQPDLRDAVKYFDENVRTVNEDRSTGFVVLAIEWHDPELAARWAILLTERLNAYMRHRALREAESNVAFLKSQLRSESVISLQQSVGQLLERELEKLMLAQGNEEFAFRVIDSASVPKVPSRPSRRNIVILSVLLGGVAAVLFVFGRHFLRVQRGRL